MTPFGVNTTNRFNKQIHVPTRSVTMSNRLPYSKSYLGMKDIVFIWKMMLVYVSDPGYSYV